jgi:hypothetical protein
MKFNGVNTIVIGSAIMLAGTQGYLIFLLRQPKPSIIVPSTQTLSCPEIPAPVCPKAACQDLGKLERRMGGIESRIAGIEKIMAMWNEDF